MKARDRILMLLSVSKRGLDAAEIAKICGWFFMPFPALYKLEGEGKIKGEWEDAAYPRRRFYHLTGGPWER